MDVITILLNRYFTSCTFLRYFGFRCETTHNPHSTMMLIVQSFVRIINIFTIWYGWYHQTMCCWRLPKFYLLVDDIVYWHIESFMKEPTWIIWHNIAIVNCNASTQEKHEIECCLHAIEFCWDCSWPERNCFAILWIKQIVKVLGRESHIVFPLRISYCCICINVFSLTGLNSSQACWELDVNIFSRERGCDFQWTILGR